MNYWAPEVHAYCGAHYMFATFKPDNGRRGTAILKSDNPLGEFKPWSNGPVTPPEWECLDGTFYIENDGTPYMVFCHEWQQAGDGEICAMPLTADLKSAAGIPRLLFTASQAAWSFPLAGRRAGCYVTDGPYLYRAKNGRLLMLWSSFGADGKYRIGVAASVSGTIVGPWTQSSQPLYAADGGHGMIFTTPDNRLLLSIHSPNDTPNERAVFIPVKEADGDLLLIP
jgi:GH43 family beta-xylosidase